MKKIKTYIIEDEYIHLEAAKICVWECEFEFIGSTDSPKEAIQQIVQNKPDIVLVDINLNGKRQGINLAKRIIGEFQIPVIFTTCFEDYKTIEEAIKTGPASYLVKPLDSANLKAAVLLALLKNNKNTQPKNTSINIFQRIIDRLLIKNNLKKEDLDFLKMLISIILKNITNPKLDIDFLTSNSGISRTGLYRKTISLTNMSTGKFIRVIRLEQAALYFEEGECSISQCAYHTGFENLSYFTKCFREYFGILPSEFKDKRV